MNQLEFWACSDVLSPAKGTTWACTWKQDLHRAATGLPIDRTQLEARVGNSVFDLASLTKVVVGGSLMVRWAESQKLSLADLGLQKVERWIPEFKGSVLGQILLMELWEHRSSLVANCNLTDTRKEFFTLSERSLLHEKLLKFFEDPQLLGASKNTLYSDLGFILLTLILERAYKTSLDVLWDEFKRDHKLQSSRMNFARDNVAIAGAMPTESRHPAGQVNDDKAYVMGGVAAHAGLFGILSDLQAWIRVILEWSQNSDQAREWLHTDRSAVSNRFSWGWDTASGALDSQAGPSAPRSTRGHLGYTGTALWIEPKTHRAAILLSNRVHPSHTLNSQKSIQTLRTWFFESFWQGTLESGWEI